MTIMLNPSVQALKTLFFQWVVENFLIPQTERFEEHVKLVILHNHMLNFSLESVTEELPHFQEKRNFYFFDQIDRLDLETLRNALAEGPFQLVIDIGVSKVAVNEKLHRCISLKEQLGLKHILILSRGLHDEINNFYGVQDVNLNDYELTSSSIDNFLSGLVGQTSWLFFGPNRQRTILEFASSLNSNGIGHALKNHYYGLIYLFDFYSRNGYLHNNLYDGYEAFTDFVVQDLARRFNQFNELGVVGSDQIRQLLRMVAIQSRSSKGKWIVQPQLLENDRNQSAFLDLVKLDNPLWTIHNSQVSWSEHSFRDYWVSDYLAGKMRASEYHIELTRSLSQGSNNLALAFLIAKIARRLLRPQLAIDILNYYVSHSSYQQGPIVRRCIEMAGTNILGWRRIDENFEQFKLDLENRNISSMIGVL